MRYPLPQTKEDRDRICTEATTIAAQIKTDLLALIGPIELVVAELYTTAAKLNDLGKPCVGHIYYRKDKDNCMYINHGNDEPCPLHGTPAPGKRLRVYIGSNPEKQAAAEAALENRDTARRLTAHFAHLQRSLQDASHSLTAAYGNIQFHPPQHGGQPKPYTSRLRQLTQASNPSQPTRTPDPGHWTGKHYIPRSQADPPKDHEEKITRILTGF